MSSGNENFLFSPRHPVFISMTDDATGTIEYQCHHCGTSIHRYPSENRGERTFCSTSCSATFYNQSRKIIQNCLGCGNPYHPIRGSRGKYCSSQCHNKHRKELVYQKIESGTYRSLNSNFLRNYLIEKRGENCQLCGWDRINPVTKKCPLQVDHVDGNAENNHPTNIRLLCGSCHTLTPTYGNLNKGRGRKIRRDRYVRAQPTTPYVEM
jgi:hypothetical protein